MDLSLSQFLTALFSIVIIDLALAGDNAIVIGMSCRNLPKNHQMKAIFFGTLGAIIIRILATLAVVWLLKLQGLMLGGGIVLVYIAYKLISKPRIADEVECKDSLWSAIGTIIVADAAMGLDNVLAIAGASHGNYLMVLLGLLISVPIMVFGSTLILKLMTRFPVIIDIGAAVIAYTAGTMMTGDKLVAQWFVNPYLKYAVIVAIVLGVFFLGREKRKKQQCAASLN